MFTKEYDVPKYEEIKAQLTLTESEKKIKFRTDNAIKAILSGQDDRKLLIVGPCSIDNEEAAFKYFEFLVRRAEKYRDCFLIIPRIYTSKSRSLSYSFNGLISSLDGGKTTDFRKGIFAARKIHIKAIGDYGLCGADEIVYPELTFYLDDVVSYFVIGARCASDTMHRHIASGLDVSVGLKNDLSGNISVLTDGLKSIIAPNTFVLSGSQYKTSGNPYAHTILRGINTETGYLPNITESGLKRLADALTKNDLPSSIIVDLNHGNSGKNAEKQFDSLELMGNALSDKRIKGFMIESYLFDGKGDGKGFSLTDSCLGTKKTDKLLCRIQEKLMEGR